MAYGESPGGNNSHGGGGFQGGATRDRKVDASGGQNEALKLRVDVLCGIIPPHNRTGAAVTVNDMRPLLEIPPWIQATELSVAPAAYDYNLLVQDMKLLYAQIEQLSNMLRKKGNFDGKLKPLPKTTQRWGA